MMTNLEKMVTGLGGLLVTAKPDIPVDVLKMIACPYEAAEDPDALEIEGCPSETQCAECKKKWLAKEVGSK